jgi:adenosylhomocysteine nucleosidase
MHSVSNVILVVTGTMREASVVAGDGVVVIAGGGSRAYLIGELARLAPDAAGIISFGMAGALDGDLRLGDWVIGSSVVGGCVMDCDARWANALAVALPQARRGAVFADGSMITTSARKRQIYGATGALAVDMESHLAAQAAARYGAPFAILRCMSDRADADLPPALAVTMQEAGRLDGAAILRSILRQPGQLPALIGMGIGFARAFRQMQKGAGELGPQLSYHLR